jgi:hypothetical protein
MFPLFLHVQGTFFGMSETQIVMILIGLFWLGIRFLLTRKNQTVRILMHSFLYTIACCTGLFWLGIRSLLTLTHAWKAMHSLLVHA